MDCTGSMGSWINACKTQLIAIVDLISQHFQRTTINLAFVGYHDHCDALPYEVLPFTTDAQATRTFISTKVTASGGGDSPEDICGGLRKALDLKWTAQNRLILLVADAPCHGSIFHDEEDSYPNGDPKGLEPEVLLSEMLEKDIHLFFSEICKSTKKMVSIWKKHYDANTKGLALNRFDLTKQEDFLPSIADAIASVITKI